MTGKLVRNLRWTKQTSRRQQPSQAWTKKERMTDLMRGDVLCLVLAYAPRNEDETARAVCRGWCDDVDRFRRAWLRRGAAKTVHPTVSYRMLMQLPKLVHRPSSPALPCAT